MANTTISIIKALGFSQHSFAVDDAAAFDALITNELGNQVDLIKIDYTAYDAATTVQRTILANAEKFRTAAALTRIQAAQSNNDAYRELAGQGASNNESQYKTAQRYDNFADIWLAKLGISKHQANESGGIASGVVIS